MQIKCPKNVSKSALIDRFSAKTALLRDSTKNGSCTRTLYSDIENKWIQSIAVGSKAFIEKMKGSLGYRAKGRKIICAEDTFELREVITPFSNAASLESENNYFWNKSIDRLPSRTSGSNDRIFRPAFLIG